MLMLCACSRLKHPNLVQLIGVVTHGLPVMIISEFMSKVRHTGALTQ